MKVASISELKDHLSAHLEGVRGGDPLLVTERKRPVALLRAVVFDDLPEEMQGLLADGVVMPGIKKMSAEEFLAQPKARFAPGLTSAVIEERDES